MRTSCLLVLLAVMIDARHLSPDVWCCDPYCVYSAMTKELKAVEQLCLGALIQLQYDELEELDLSLASYVARRPSAGFGTC